MIEVVIVGRRLVNAKASKAALVTSKYIFTSPLPSGGPLKPTPRNCSEKGVYGLRSCRMASDERGPMLDHGHLGHHKVPEELICPGFQRFCT